MEVDIAALEEGEESVYFLVVRYMFDKGDEDIPHSHVMSVSFSNEAYRGLGIDSTVQGGCKVGILEGCI